MRVDCVTYSIHLLIIICDVHQLELFCDKQLKFTFVFYPQKKTGKWVQKNLYYACVFFGNIPQPAMLAATSE